jgi:hypothetical protein
MAKRKGRPSKPGKRHPGGQLVHEPQIVKGSDWVQAQQAKYQTHYNTALGRAYAAGLLADNQDIALDRYQGGKRFARVHNRVCGGETYRCPLDRTPRGSESPVETFEHDKRDRDWLFAAMDSMDVLGVRPYLDQLITRAHTDRGPAWLDRLLAGGKDPADRMLLKAAIQALEVVAPARKEVGILVERWDDAA